MAKKRKKLKARTKTARIIAADNGNNGILRGLDNLLPSRKNERFLLGLLIGAGAAYLFSDKNLRGKIIKSAMKLYSGFAGEFAEIKEQFADFKAEFETEYQTEET